MVASKKKSNAKDNLNMRAYEYIISEAIVPLISFFKKIVSYDSKIIKTFFQNQIFIKITILKSPSNLILRKKISYLAI